MKNKAFYLLFIAAFALSSCGKSDDRERGNSTSEATSSYSSSSSSSIHEHAYSGSWSSDETYHWHAATCGHDVESEKEKHTYASSITNPTYDEGGYTTHTCTVCGYSYTDSNTDKLEHHYSAEWSKDSDYHWHACDDKGYEGLKMDESEHTYESSVTEPTYESQGYTTHTCTVCGYSYKDSYTDKLSHGYSLEWSYDSKVHWRQCTDGGYENLKIDEEKHSLSVETVEPTCEAQGYDLHTCTVCGYSYKDNYVKEIDHKFEDEVIAPTHDSNGYTKHTCSVCGYSYEDSPTDKLKYVITWEDWDGNILKTDNLEKGQTPSFGEDPKREMSKYETYSFKGWEPSIEPASRDITYKATYDAHVSETEFIVSFDSNGGEDFAITLTKQKGASLTLLPDDQPYRKGYIFYGWNNIYENVIYGSDDKFEGDFNVTFFATWLPICSDCKGSGGTTNTTCEVCDGKGNVTVDATLYGTDFVYSAQCTNCNGTGIVSKTLNCKKCNGVGYLFEDGPKVEKTGSSKVTLCTTDGYEYSVDGSNWQSSPIFDNLAPNTAYSFYQRKASAGKIPFGVTSKATTVTTLKASYTITYVLNGGFNDSENPDSYSYESGNIVLKDPSRDGYTFGGWYSDESLETKVTGIPSESSGDLTFYAKWEANLNQLSIKSEKTTRGTVSFTGAGYTGEEIKATAKVSKEYTFKGWYSDGKFVSGRNPYKFKMPAHDISLTAMFLTKSEADEMQEKQKLGLVPAFDTDSDTVTYGLYPQTHVSDKTLISSLNGLAAIASNGWYLYEGSYYMKTNGNPNSRYNTFSSGWTIKSDTNYWFKCEPIEWRILSSPDGKCSLVSSVLLDTHVFYSSYSDRTIDGKTIYSNNYQYSDVREWLNGDFYGSAFALDNSFIQAVTVDNSAATTDSLSNEYACSDTKDKVYLLSYQDYLNADYSLSCKATDWALANYAYQYNGYSSYWTRSPDSKSSRSVSSLQYWSNKTELTHRSVTNEDNCVRPAITIKVP